MLLIRYVRRLAKPFLVTVLLLGGFALFQAWSNNFHEVLPGELYRSGQFWKGDVETYVEKHGIRSIINLRGDNTGKPWYDDEVSEAARAGVEHFDFRMSSKRMLNREELVELIGMMRDAPKPLLIHCHGGANRTSLAAALYLAAITKADERTADAQMSIRFGNFPEWMGSQSKMSRNFELVEDILSEEEPRLISGDPEER